MRGKAHTGPKCKNELHKYDGRLVSALKTQFELEDLARHMCEAFVHNGNDMVLAYVAHMRAQPTPWERHAIYLFLAKDDKIDTTDPAWFVLPEKHNPDRLPVEWGLLEDMAMQLMVVVCVAGRVDDKPCTVKLQAMHMIDALMGEPKDTKN